MPLYLVNSGIRFLGDVMDFYVGKIERLRDKKVTKKILPAGMIEGEIITLRRSRSKLQGETLEKERRRRKAHLDPGSAKILILMIGDGFSLPEDFDSRRYKVLIRLRRIP